MRSAGFIFAIALSCLMGCDNSSRASSSPPSLPKSVPGNGIIRGSVRFVGTAPEIKTFQATEACCKGEPPIVDQTVVVNTNGSLRNVFVYLEGGPQTDGSAQPPVLLDQVRCSYAPHALGVQAAQPLRIRSSDPTMHNVHFNPSLNRARNLALTQVGAEVRTTFDHAEFIRMKCDVHPWMTAWVGVFENPFYALTQDEGTYEIKGVPAGSYKLVAWHELFGRQEQSVSIVDDKPLNVEFAFGRRPASG